MCSQRELLLAEEYQQCKQKGSKDVTNYFVRYSHWQTSENS